MVKVLFVLGFLLISSVFGGDFKIPSFSYVGENVQAKCDVDHGSFKINSITWFKDDQEFYRYVPGDPDSPIITPVKGVNIRRDASMEGNSIYFVKVTYDSTGVYKCKVDIDHATISHGELSGTLTVIPSLN